MSVNDEEGVLDLLDSTKHTVEELIQAEEQEFQQLVRLSQTQMSPVNPHQDRPLSPRPSAPMPGSPRGPVRFSDVLSDLEREIEQNAEPERERPEPAKREDSFHLKPPRITTEEFEKDLLDYQLHYDAQRASYYPQQQQSPQLQQSPANQYEQYPPQQVRYDPRPEPPAPMPQYHASHYAPQQQPEQNPNYYNAPMPQNNYAPTPSPPQQQFQNTNNTNPHPAEHYAHSAPNYPQEPQEYRYSQHSNDAPDLSRPSQKRRDPFQNYNAAPDVDPDAAISAMPNPYQLSEQPDAEAVTEANNPYMRPSRVEGSSFPRQELQPQNRIEVYMDELRNQADEDVESEINHKKPKYFLPMFGGMILVIFGAILSFVGNIVTFWLGLAFLCLGVVLIAVPVLLMRCGWRNHKMGDFTAGFTKKDAGEVKAGEEAKK